MPVSNPGALFGIDFRMGYAFIMGLTERGKFELVCRLPLGEELQPSLIFSDRTSFSAAFSLIHQTLVNLGGKPESYLLCVPDSFSQHSWLQLQKLASDAEIVLAGIIRESAAAALYFYYGQRRPGNLMTVNIERHSAAVSLFSLGGGAVSQLHSCIRPTQHGLAQAIRENLVSYPFTLSGNYPTVLLTTGKPDASSEADQLMKQILSSERPQNCSAPACFTSSSGEVFRLGLGVFCGLRTHVLSGLRLEESFSPCRLYASAGGKGILLSDPVIPFRAVIADTLPAEALLSPLFLTEEGAAGIFDYLDRIDLSNIKLCKNETFRLALACDEERNLSVCVLGSDDREISVIPVTGRHPVCPPKTEAPGQDDTILGFLPVIDSLEYGAAQACENHSEPSGLAQIYKQSLTALEKMGVTRYGQAGDVFDAHLHQAVAHVTDIDLPENVVKQVLQSGYRRKEKILRYASVVVAN